MIVYGLREKGSDDVRYVGITNRKLNERLGRHRNDKNIGHKTNWIKKIGKNNVEIFIIEDGIKDLDVLYEKEIYYIDKFKKEGHDLTNATKGGEGWKNSELSEEHKKNISKNHADVSKEKNPMWGKNHNTESKEKIREFRLGSTLRDETKLKMSLKKQGEKNNNSKLKENDVLEIKNLLNDEKFTKKEISIMYNVKPAAISKIANGITWKHL